MKRVNSEQMEHFLPEFSLASGEDLQTWLKLRFVPLFLKNLLKTLPKITFSKLAALECNEQHWLTLCSDCSSLLNWLLTADYCQPASEFSSSTLAWTITNFATGRNVRCNITDFKFISLNMSDEFFAQFFRLERKVSLLSCPDFDLLWNLMKVSLMSAPTIIHIHLDLQYSYSKFLQLAAKLVGLRESFFTFFSARDESHVHNM